MIVVQHGSPITNQSVTTFIINIMMK